MGQIVIDIPTRKTRRYVVTDAMRAEMLLNSLDETATRVRSGSAKLTKEQLQDIQDAEAAMKSLENYRKAGISYSIEDLEKEL